MLSVQYDGQIHIFKLTPMDMTRGSTSVGNGSISNYYFVPDEVFDVNYFTEIHATIPGDYKIYTDVFNDAMADACDYIEPLLEPLALDRLKTVKAEAEQKYRDGVKEYKDGVKEYEDGKAEAEQKLHDAFQELIDGQDKLRETDFKLRKGEKQIKEGLQGILNGRITLANSRQQLADSKIESLKTLTSQGSKLAEQYESALGTLTDSDQKWIAVQSEVAQAEMNVVLAQASIMEKENACLTEITALESQITEKQIQITALETEKMLLELMETPDEARIAEITAQLSALSAEITDIEGQIQGKNAELEIIRAPKYEAEAKRDEVRAKEKEIAGKRAADQASADAIQQQILNLAVQQAAMEMQFSVMESQMNAGEAKLDASEAQLEKSKQDIADGWKALEDGIKEWHDGYDEYRKGKAEALQEIADAEAELEEAAEKLADARKTIDDMTKNDVIVLDRNSNIGYTSLDSSSNIVAAVSKVFPVFFLLVAALVCITTMTRMVDEERTQIGTLKALGYSSGSIISKYLIYAGSSAVLGCTVGVILGSVIFPVLLWEAYKIMIYITPQITVRFDWWLCILVIICYTAVMLLVTWDCCRKALEEVPAELIRPKAPAAGKQLIFEKMAVWKHISFLNKVTIRNIFRYRQRLAMMMLGIGGCAALLLTGFGFRDSIMNIVDIQFDEVTVYDMEVYFRSGRTEEEQAAFRQNLAPYADDILFYYETSAEIDGENQTKDISLMVATEELRNFIDFHKGKESLPFPGENELLLSSGMAAMLNLKTGDTVSMRNMDLETLELTISGIYDNHVRNFAIISPTTMEAQWGRTPENQMALVNAKEGQDVYAVGAIVNNEDGVMNVTVSQETAEMVGSMMEALNLVVLLIVVCAGLLASIVLYNLTNININERIREIATIKVLGFNAMEAAMYVFKENLVLSVMGSAFGMILGQFLLRFVVDQIKIDMIWIQPRLVWMSYVLSVLFTIFMAILVDFVFYFRLDKINMAEALKSVE